MHDPAIPIHYSTFTTSTGSYGRVAVYENSDGAQFCSITVNGIERDWAQITEEGGPRQTLDPVRP